MQSLSRSITRCSAPALILGVALLASGGAGAGPNETVDAGVVAPSGGSEADSLGLLLPALPAETRVLHIGDSFAGALGRELNKALSVYGISGTTKFKRSTYIPTWASSKELGLYLHQYQPDLVLVTLGANELLVPDPTDRIRTIRKLVGRIGDRPCVWVGVPLWPGARDALPQVIRENAAPCRYLDSNELYPDMPRAKDGIHPSISARAEWATRVVGWLRREIDPRAAAQGIWRFREPGVRVGATSQAGAPAPSSTEAP